MKTRNTTTKLITMAIALSAMAAIWAVWGANQMVTKASPKDAQTVSYGTGVYNFARGQATSAHVVNAGEERGIEISWRVLDSASSVHAQSDRRRVELGQASSFDFGPLDLAEGQRMAIRVELRVEGLRETGLSSSPPRRCTTSVTPRRLCSCHISSNDAQAVALTICEGETDNEKPNRN